MVGDPTLRAPDVSDDVDVAALPLIVEGHDVTSGDVLGVGGMGVVSSARQSALGRDVAVKRARAGDKEAIVSLVREARILGALEHPNIPPVHWLARDASGTPVLLMKRIEGRSWGSMLAAGDRESIERSLEILEAVCHALHFAHERGIVHRDVKPDNIMLGTHGEIQLVDWGIAVSILDRDGRGLPSVSRSRSLAGTPAYMAPEMARRAAGDQTAVVTPRTDVYLVGATLYEVLGGRAPHDGLSASEAVAHAREGNVSPLPVSTLPSVAAVCMRALARAPEDRFESAEALRQALASCRKRLATAGLVRASLERTSRLAALAAKPIAPADADLVCARALRGEATFGFDQALLVAADDPAARAGRDEATRALAWLEVRAGNAGAAATLAAELASVPGDLAEAIAALQARHSAEAQELARLRVLARDHDAKLGGAARKAIAVGMAVLWGAFSAGAIALGRVRGETQQFVFILAVLVPITFCATVVVSVLVLRPIMPLTAFNRRFVVGLLLAGGWLLVSRVHTVYVMKQHLYHAIANDLAGLALLMTALGTAMDARLVVVGVMFLPCAIAAMIVPTHSPEILTLALVLFGVTLARVWRSVRDGDSL